ncbi:hypothetical protein D3C83_146450 [compost metagenome]
MKSNALFNSLFLIFSFAVIAVVSGNIQLTDSALTQIQTDTKETQVVYEQEYALNTNIGKAIYQHKI